MLIILDGARAAGKRTKKMLLCAEKISEGRPVLIIWANGSHSYCRTMRGLIRAFRRGRGRFSREIKLLPHTQIAIQTYSSWPSDEKYIRKCQEVYRLMTARRKDVTDKSKHRDQDV